MFQQRRLHWTVVHGDEIRAVFKVVACRAVLFRVTATEIRSWWRIPKFGGNGGGHCGVGFTDLQLLEIAHQRFRSPDARLVVVPDIRCRCNAQQASGDYDNCHEQQGLSHNCYSTPGRTNTRKKLCIINLNPRRTVITLEASPFSYRNVLV